MRAKLDMADDGRRLIRVVFRRQSPDSDAPQIEVVYRLYWPEDFTIEGQPYVLMPLSCTRVDTREQATLSPGEVTLAMETAVGHAATIDQDWNV